MKKRNLVFTIIIALLLLYAAFLLAGQDTAVGQEKIGEQPWIEYMQMPINGAQPAECAGQTGCVTVCFYIAEDVQDFYEWELSCVPMVVQN